MTFSNGAGGFDEICSMNGLQIEPSSLLKMEKYVSSLLSWNGKINLISRASTENIWSEHILHSITPILLGIFPGKSPVLDLGSGGGLPGIPLAILFPNLRITLVDSIQKKTKVLREIVRETGLENVDVATGRAEELRELRGRFEVVVTRGVATLDQLVRWGSTLLAERGERTLIAYKGGVLVQEIADAGRQRKSLKVTELDIRLSGEEKLSSAGKKLVLVKI